MAGLAACAAAPERAVVPIRIQANVCTGVACERMTVAGGSAVLIDHGLHESRPVVMALTAAHCVQFQASWGNPRPEIFINGQWRAAGIHSVSRDSSVDLALIWCEADRVELARLAVDETRDGDQVSVASMVYGVEFASSPGTIMEHKGAEIVIETRQIRHAEGVSAGAVFAGESGGAVFDRSGNLCGIVSSHRVRTEWRSQAVSIVAIRKWLTKEWSRAFGLPGPGARQRPREDDPRLAPENASPKSAEKIAGPEATAGEKQSAKTDTGSTAPSSKQSSPPSVTHPTNVDEAPRGSGFDFLKSLVPLGLAVAGTVATGGAGWFTLVRPVTNSIAKAVGVIEEVARSVRSHQPNQPIASPLPQDSSKPVVIVNEQPPAPSEVVTQTRVAQVEVDRVSEALNFAFGEVFRTHKNSTGVVEAIRSIANQYLSGQGSAARI